MESFCIIVHNQAKFKESVQRKLRVAFDEAFSDPWWMAGRDDMGRVGNLVSLVDPAKLSMHNTLTWPQIDGNPLLRTSGRYAPGLIALRSVAL